MKNEGPRVLRKDVGSVKVLSGDESLSWAISGPAGNGWEVVTIAGVQQLQWSDFIDLSGYSRDDRTFFPGQPLLQEAGTHIGSGVAFFGRWDFITNSPIQTAAPIFDGAAWAVPSFLGSETEPESTIWGQQRVIAASTDTGQYITTDRHQFGMGDATASDRLYCYIQIPLGQNVAGHVIQLPPCAFILPGMVAEEADLVYINRLRRSYELQQSPDVD
jgi:hypothetical protein